MSVTLKRGKAAMFAKGRLKAGVMNGTEKKYADLLRLRQIAGEIIWFEFESMTLKLADDTRYTPDFVVMMADLTLEVFEVKGWAQEDAIVKWKVAAEKFPFRFHMVFALPKKDGGGWRVRTYGE